MRGTKTAFIRTRLEGVLIPFCVTYADVLMSNCSKKINNLVFKD